jgi:hypothetical protein
MTDIYNIYVPFGLLNDETKAALRGHRDRGGKIESFRGVDAGWQVENWPSLHDDSVTFRAVKR